MIEKGSVERKNLMTEQIKKLGKGVQIAEEQGDKRLVEGFIADAFRGRVSFSEIFPWPEQSLENTRKAEELLRKLDKFLREKVNPDLTDESRDIPFELFGDMADMGMFRLKIPEELGGLGLGQTDYGRVISYLTSYYGPMAILVSADNTIGCKFPVWKYGTKEQKEKYLPELMKWPSGFCFTEKNVGSDPARMETYALRVKENGKTVGYRITGQKEYTTNSVVSDGIPLAKFLSVVVRIVDDPGEIQTTKDVKNFCFGLFIVPTSSEGVSVGERLDIGLRNEFFGMHGIYNANPLFENVWANPDQLIGGEGNGFRIALRALNTGRMAIASSCVSIAKQCFSGSKNYAEKRIQWGTPIIDKELIGTEMLARRGLCYIFAMDAMTRYASLRFDAGKDSRLEATSCKVFSSERMWTIVDNNVQIHGGIGYETHKSSSRRRKVFPADRFFRDARPDRIFEGSTQILSQWLVGEGMKFLKPVAQMGAWKEKFLLLCELTVNRINFVRIPDVPRPLRKHLKFAKRRIRKFSNRILFFAVRDMVLLALQSLADEKDKKKLAREMLTSRQLILWRLFWIVSYLEAIVASCSCAVNFGTDSAIEMADGFCGEARICIDNLFKELYKNNDRKMRKIADGLKEGRYDWFIHSDILPLVEKLDL